MMDEVLFRSSQKLESLQFQLGVAANESKKVALQLTSQTKSYIITALSSQRSVELQEWMKHLWASVLHVADVCKCTILFHINPRRLIDQVTRVFISRWSSRDVYFGCAGLVIGGLIGLSIGASLYKHRTYRYMQAIQCTNYIGIEGVLFVEDAIAPQSCDNNEVQIAVKAGSVQVIDADICNGHGKIIRRLLSKFCQYSKHDLPITLGRDCTGVITDLGTNVTRFEVGDEVWLTSPFWAPGTLSQTVSVPEHRVSKKPSTVGFEGACSLPYSGSTALAALNRISLNKMNTKNKRIFIQGACTPVGCVLIQVLKLWGANITATCFKRAVPVAKALGADDVIVLMEPEIKMKSNNNLELLEITADALIKELELQDKFDVIINTKKCGVSEEQFKKFCGSFVSTTAEKPLSDTYGVLMVAVFGIYVKIKCTLQKSFGYEIHDFGETHMCHSSLDELTELVENGLLKTLVDKVFHPPEIDKALQHVQSTDSIGSTIITFR